MQKVRKINPEDNDVKLHEEKYCKYEGGMYKQWSASKAHVGKRTTNIETNANIKYYKRIKPKNEDETRRKNQRQAGEYKAAKESEE